MDTQEVTYPIALFNGTIATTNGLYRIDDISIPEAKALIDTHGFISAIGHESTAQIMSDVFEQDIKMSRIQFRQQIGQLAIVFKLNKRPAEGSILVRDEIERIGYTFKIMRRLE